MAATLRLVASLVSRITGPLLRGALANVTHYQSTQKEQHESIGI